MRRGHGETSTVVPLAQRGQGAVCCHHCSVLEMKGIYCLDRAGRSGEGSDTGEQELEGKPRARALGRDGRAGPTG